MQNEKKPKLKQRALKASAWLMGGRFTAQGVRLGQHLIIARILFPEAFGLMALVGVFTQGLHMFSDIGIQPSIIHSKRGDEADFLNTAWTIQIIRGVVLWLMGCGIAAVLWIMIRYEIFPTESVYGDIRIVQMLPIITLSSIASGFGTTKRYVMNRKLALGRLTIYELSNRVVQAVITITLALMWPTVWALVWGLVLGTLVGSVAGHFVFKGVSNRLRWERSAAVELIGFGKWVFLSTIFTFFIRNADRLILSGMLSSTVLGLYHVAFTLGGVVARPQRRLSDQVLFPLYAQLERRKDKAFKRNMYRVRLPLLATGLPVMWMIAIFGQQIVGFLYNDLYHEAGWMLQLISLGFIFQLMCISTQSVMLAKGDSFRMMVNTGVTGALKIGLMFAGGYMYGFKGVLIGVVLGEFAAYPVLIWTIYPYRVWMPVLDLSGFCISAFVIGIGWWLMDTCPFVSSFFNFE